MPRYEKQVLIVSAKNVNIARSICASDYNCPEHGFAPAAVISLPDDWDGSHLWLCFEDANDYAQYVRAHRA